MGTALIYPEPGMSSVIAFAIALEQAQSMQ